MKVILEAINSRSTYSDLVNGTQGSGHEELEAS
jgi:hypothetical protein